MRGWPTCGSGSGSGSGETPHRRSPARLAAVCCALGVAGVALSSCSSSPSHPHGHSARKSTTTTLAPGTSTSATTSPALAGSWTTYGGGFSRTSVDSTDPTRSTAPVEAWKSQSLDGDVYGEPLVYHGDVFVATENDTVYGFSVTDGAPIWPADHLATPAPASALPCGDITPTVGITSTMVIDPSTGVLFASAEISSTSSSSGVAHWLYALSTSTGKVLWSRDVDQSWVAADQLQRPGLALDDGNVLIGFGGNYGDCGQYHGWVVSVPESGTGAIVHYQVPTANQGAIWGPAGITVDSSGDVYVATGNGSATAGQAFDHGDAVIKLSAQLNELGYFAPTNWAQDNADDLDLGSTAPVLLGNGQLFEIGKEQTAYLVSTSSLGGIGGQLASLSVCSSKGATAYEAPYAYVICDSLGQIVQVQVGPGDALHTGWTWSSPTGGASSPTIAGGVLWSIDQGASKLYGVDLANGTTLYAVSLDVGTLVHFVSVSAADGMLFVAGNAGLEAFR